MVSRYKNAYHFTIDVTVRDVGERGSCRLNGGFQNFSGYYTSLYGTKYYVGIICPPDWNSVTVSAKTWWGPVPIHAIWSYKQGSYKQD